MLQFLLDLSDRDAAEAVRCRIDFKYALGPGLDDPGFHHSVLGDSVTGCWRKNGPTGSLTWPWPG
ncbi:MAG: transposase [Actinomycetota bacterium]|nr:transposase [Actinomycetota bacterium]